MVKFECQVTGFEKSEESKHRGEGIMAGQACASDEEYARKLQMKLQVDAK